MNQVGLVGRLTKDPSTRTLSEGRVHTTFIVAVSRNYKNQKGEIETDFVLCSTWGRPAVNVAKFCVKGSLVAISGRLQSRHYDKEDGTRVYVTEIQAEQVRFLDRKKAQEETAPSHKEPESEADFDFPVPEAEPINA